MKILTFLLSICSSLLTAQTDLQKLVDSLKYITDMPYICETGTGEGCGDRLFWKVVQQKEAAIPLLIARLSDATVTVATVPNFGGQWAVGDIAYSALSELILDIPTFELLGVPFDTRGCGYCAYWRHLRKRHKNRKQFKAAVSTWYESNKAALVWVVSDEFQTCDCSGKHPNGGHFELKK